MNQEYGCNLAMSSQRYESIFFSCQTSTSLWIFHSLCTFRFTSHYHPLESKRQEDKVCKKPQYNIASSSHNQLPELGTRSALTPRTAEQHNRIILGTTRASTLSPLLSKCLTVRDTTFKPSEHPVFVMSQSILN
jgi:hypothetical protein